VSELAPKVISIKIPTDKIGLIIGPGGKNIKGMSEKSGSKINIDDDGTVTIYCAQKEGAEMAQKMIESMIEEPVVGKTYKGTVKRIMDFGAFVEILPGKEGLVHISKLKAERVENVSDVVSEGQELEVQVTEVDKMGRINLATTEAIAAHPEHAQPRPPRPFSREGGDRHYGDRGRPSQGGDRRGPRRPPRRDD
jgi:polyribonucleotide nucleotidyltransferase